MKIVIYTILIIAAVLLIVASMRKKKRTIHVCDKCGGSGWLEGKLSAALPVPCEKCGGDGEIIK